MTKSQSAILTRVFGISTIMFVLGGLMIYWAGKPVGTHPRSGEIPSSKDTSSRPTYVATPDTNNSHSQNSVANSKPDFVTPVPPPTLSTNTREPVVRNGKQSPAQGTTAREYEDYLRKRPLVVKPAPPDRSNRRDSIPPDYRKTPRLPRTTKKENELGDRLERVAKDAIKSGLDRLFKTKKRK